MPGFKVCVSALYDVRTTTKSPNYTFLRMYPRRYATHDYMSPLLNTVLSIKGNH